MGALITTFLTALPHLLKAAKAVPQVASYIKQTHTHLQQSKEWTAEQEAEFDKHLEEVTSQPWWQPESGEK